MEILSRLKLLIENRRQVGYCILLFFLIHAFQTNSPSGEFDLELHNYIKIYYFYFALQAAPNLV